MVSGRRPVNDGDSPAVAQRWSLVAGQPLDVIVPSRVVVGVLLAIRRLRANRDGMTIIRGGAKKRTPHSSPAAIEKLSKDSIRRTLYQGAQSESRRAMTPV